MPEILSRFLKASAAAAPMLLSANASLLANDTLIDINLLNEARTLLLGDMQAIYNVSDDALAIYAGDESEIKSLEEEAMPRQILWQDYMHGLYPDMPRAEFLHTLETSNSFLNDALIATVNDLKARASEDVPEAGQFHRVTDPDFGIQDNISALLGLMSRVERPQLTRDNPFNFFNLAQTDRLSLQTPYVPATAEALAPFRTLAFDANAPKIVMLPPTPKHGAIVDSDLAHYEAMNYETRAQWQAGYDLLSGLGADIIVLDAEGTEGGVRVSGSLEYFVRDEAFVFPDAKMAFYPWKNILTGLNKADETLTSTWQETGKPGYEVIHEMTAGPYREMMEEQGFEFLPIPSKTQGGDFLVHPAGKFALLADNNEENIDEIIQTLEDKTGYEILLVPKTRKDTYYHLDTFAMVLPHGEVMIYPHATTERFMADLEQRVGAGNMILLDQKDAQAAVINMMSVGDTLVMPAASPELTAQLEEHGYKVLTPASFPENNISFYTHQHGYLHCQTQELSFSP